VTRDLGVTLVHGQWQHYFICKSRKKNLHKIYDYYQIKKKYASSLNLRPSPEVHG